MSVTEPDGFLKIKAILGRLPHEGDEQFRQDSSKLSNHKTSGICPENLTKFYLQHLSATEPDGFSNMYENVGGGDAPRGGFIFQHFFSYSSSPRVLTNS